MAKPTIAQLIADHPTWGRVRLQAATGLPQRAVSTAIRLARSGVQDLAAAAKPRPVRALSVAEFKARYDQDTKAILAVRKAVRTIRPGRTMLDHDLRRQVGFADAAAWNDAVLADTPEARAWRKMRIRSSDKRIHWTDPQTAAELIETCSGTTYADEGVDA